jgi:hypothetical protein
MFKTYLSVVSIWVFAAVTACDSKDRREKVTNPEKLSIESHFNIGGWWVGLPADETSLVNINDVTKGPGVTQVKESLPFVAMDGQRKQHKFLATVTVDSCSDYKTTALSQEIAGEVEGGYWFIANEGNEFRHFMGNIRSFNYCLSIVIKPEGSLGAQSASSELARYFKLILDDAHFMRLAWLENDDQQLEQGFKAPNISYEKLQFAEDGGVSKAEVSSPLVSLNGEKLIANETVIVGECSSPAFADLLNDKTRGNFSPTVLELATFKVFTSNSTDGATKLEANGIYKLKESSSCMIVRFEVSGPENVKSDSELKNLLLTLLSIPDVA